MAITIDDDILKRTTKCYKIFDCLSVRLHDMCEVERFLGSNGVLQIQLKNGNSCGYYVRLDDLDFCTCPTRLELYKRYGI